MISANQDHNEDLCPPKRLFGRITGDDSPNVRSVIDTSQSLNRVTPGFVNTNIQLTDDVLKRKYIRESTAGDQSRGGSSEDDDNIISPPSRDIQPRTSYKLEVSQPSCVCLTIAFEQKLGDVSNKSSAYYNDKVRNPP